MSASSRYCAAYAASQLSPETFARQMLGREPTFCLEVIEEIGSWPSSEPELRALQEIYP